jgi:hypothetical protein
LSELAQEKIVCFIEERFGNEWVNEVARALDQKVEELAKYAASQEEPIEKPHRPPVPRLVPEQLGGKGGEVLDMLRCKQ